MALKRWVFCDLNEKKVENLCGTIGVSRLAGTALVSRGVTCAASAESFLNCDYPLGDALQIKDMQKGAERVREAIETGERIAIFGDYDVDGIMSTALMHQYLESVGADVVSLLPERECTGYGLVPSSVDNIAALGATVVVTVDNGVSSHDAIEYAKARGIDTVVCDHHKVPETLPDAYAVIDPMREDDTSAFKELAGVGVALKLAAAIEGCSVEEMMEQYGYLAAIGTVSDVMPLVEENRVIVKQGLAQLRYGENLGLAALIEEVGLSPEDISARDVAFTLAPRLNAAGRMASAKTALEMLLTDDWETAGALAKELTELNCQRQMIEQEMVASMVDAVSKDPDALMTPILVISGMDYSAGVSGIVCSRLVERYGKPVIIISIDGGEAKGSGRSIDGFSLYNAIDSCGDLLESFGGHDMAAGFTIDPSRIDEFRARICDYCKTLPESIPYHRIRVNSAIGFSDIGEGQVEELLRLAPFGCGNEEPVFATLSAEIAEINPLGDKHCRITFRKDDQRLKAALFCVRPDELVFEAGERVDIAYVLSLYHPDGKRGCVSVKLKAIVPEGFSKEDFRTLKLFDRMCFGQRLDDAERAEIAPAREDIAVVYRAVKKKPLPAGDREKACFRFCEIKPGKALACLSVLCDLELLENRMVGDGLFLAVKDSPVKKELEQSGIYAMLNGGRS